MMLSDLEKIKQSYKLIDQGMNLTDAVRSSGFHTKRLLAFRRTKEYQALYDYYMKRKKQISHMMSVLIIFQFFLMVNIISYHKKIKNIKSVECGKIRWGIYMIKTPYIPCVI